MTTGEPSPNAIAQFAHFFAGSTIVLSFALFGHVGWGVGFLLTWAVPKEFIWDIRVEKDSWLASLEDFTFYCVGLVYAVALYHVS